MTIKEVMLTLTDVRNSIRELRTDHTIKHNSSVWRAIKTLENIEILLENVEVR